MRGYINEYGVTIRHTQSVLQFVKPVFSKTLQPLSLTEHNHYFFMKDFPPIKKQMSQCIWYVVVSVLCVYNNVVL